jgi:thiamine-phosphate pyrophosphorylase
MRHALYALRSSEVFLSVDFKLYLITDRKQTRMPLPDAVRLALKGGVRAIQLRERDLPIRVLLAVAQELRKLTNEFDAKLFINDRVDVSVAVEADGVHLGHQSMPPEAVRKIVNKKMLIGVSTHNPEEARAAEKNGADFITYGPVYLTPSKADLGLPVGPESIINIINRVKIPVFGLGGIKSGNIDQVLSFGADGISMISEIFASDDIESKSREILEKVAKARIRS